MCFFFSVGKCWWVMSCISEGVISRVISSRLNMMIIGSDRVSMINGDSIEWKLFVLM